ncbi:hypothetical protein BCR26_08850 [Enterococcus rivorum]|uniref:Uncharacterized protein n=1 Tax=Enterococcus rivorum TaxID=762845 RepID=A0A1E5L0E3_9ENTE|nr:hypothetical protein BCR26_08850 [Enterococcus rivorum]
MVKLFKRLFLFKKRQSFSLSILIGIDFFKRIKYTNLYMLSFITIKKSNKLSFKKWLGKKLIDLIDFIKREFKNSIIMCKKKRKNRL